jgi:hypothetical protein
MCGKQLDKKEEKKSILRGTLMPFVTTSFTALGRRSTVATSWSYTPLNWDGTLPSFTFGDERNPSTYSSLSLVGPSAVSFVDNVKVFSTYQIQIPIQIVRPFCCKQIRNINQNSHIRVILSLNGTFRRELVLNDFLLVILYTMSRISFHLWCMLGGSV